MHAGDEEDDNVATAAAGRIGKQVEKCVKLDMDEFVTH